MITNEGPKVIEFNCRFGDPECQALMPLIGSNIALILQAAALGKLEKAPSLSISKLLSVCVVAAATGYPQHPKSGDEILIELEKDKNSLVQLFHSGTKINTQGKLITSGGRVLSVVAQGDNYDDAFELAYETIKKVNFSGRNFRQDIGYQVRN